MPHFAPEITIHMCLMTFLNPLAKDQPDNGRVSFITIFKTNIFKGMCYTRKQNIFQMSLRHSIQQQFSYGVEHKGFHS